MTDEVGFELGELEAIVAEEDGYSAESSAEALLHGIGLPPEECLKTMQEIPQDMQFRALLCQALFGDPQALLLDEPTNHLDLASIGWLERFLKSYRGTLIVVSHDRHFLNSVTTHIADIDYETIIIYPGNYDEMVVTKSSVRSREEKEAKSKEKKIAQLRDFVAKFGSGTRASQVQSRIKEIDRLQPQEFKSSNIQRPYIRFIPIEKQAGKIVLKAAPSQKPMTPPSSPTSLSRSSEATRSASSGTTALARRPFLKCSPESLPRIKEPSRLGHQVCCAYFPQNHERHRRQALLRNPLRLAERPEKQACMTKRSDRSWERCSLAAMMRLNTISALSGGETARLIIGGMVLADHNLIIMDEPNNHLDLEAVSALGWALEEYKGTAIVASHDRDLIDRFATKIIAFDGKGVTIFDGPLEEYLSNTASRRIVRRTFRFSKGTFRSLKKEQQHKKCAELLRELFCRPAPALQTEYAKLCGWLGMALIAWTQEEIEQRFHLHVRASGRGLAEADFLSFSVGDRATAMEWLGIHTYLDGLRSAHNVGSILRTVEAFRMGPVHFSEDVNHPSLKGEARRETFKPKLSRLSCRKAATLYIGQRPTSECFLSSDLSKPW